MRTSNILLVEDEDSARGALREYIRSEGFVVSEASTFKTASAMICEADAMVSDLRLPDGSGVDLIRGLKPDNSWKKVIVISAYRGSIAEAESAFGSAASFYDKPLLAPKLDAIVKELVAFDGKQKAFNDKIRACIKYLDFLSVESDLIERQEASIKLKRYVLEHLWQDLVRTTPMHKYVVSVVRVIFRKTAVIPSETEGLLGFTPRIYSLLSQYFHAILSRQITEADAYRISEELEEIGVRHFPTLENISGDI